MSRSLESAAQLFSEACEECEDAEQEISRLQEEIKRLQRKRDEAKARVSQLHNELLEAARERYRDQ